MKAKVTGMRIAALLSALILTALWFFMPLKTQSTRQDEDNSGRKKAELAAGESLSWDWVPLGDAGEVAFRLSGEKNAADLTLKASVTDGQGKTVSETILSFADAGTDAGLSLAGNFAGGAKYTITVGAEGEGSIKFRGEETEAGFVPVLIESGTETRRNITLVWLAGGLLLLAFLPVKAGRSLPKARKDRGVAALLPWLCLISVLATGAAWVFSAENPVLTGNYCAWDESIHWEEGIRCLVVWETPEAALSKVSNWTLGYLPLTLGAGIGRLFTDRGEILYRFAVCFGVLGYGILCALAVKTAPRYKATFAVISLLPGILFLASRATYDTMVIGAVLLGFAMLLKVWEEDEPSGALIFVMTAMLALGTAAKPAYTLMMLPLLLIPGKKLGGKANGWIYRIFVLLFIAWSLGSVLLPGVYDEVRGGDTRFPDDPDAPAQIRYLCSKPLEWVLVPLRHLGGHFVELFITPLCARDTGNNPAAAWILTGMLLLAAPLAVTGEEKDDKGLKPGFRILTGAAALLVPVVLTLTQYIVSSAVGGTGVQGMQPRYILPVWIGIALTAMLPRKVRRAVSGGTGDILALVLCGAVFGMGMWFALAGMA